MDTACRKCSDTGWELIIHDGRRVATRCKCAIARGRDRMLKQISPRDSWASLDALTPCDDASICFASAEQQDKVIRALRAKPDSSYAFFGPTGVAKSTYLAALFRHAVETQGTACFYTQMAELARGLRNVELGRGDSPYLSRQVISRILRTATRPRIFIDEFDKTSVSEFVRNGIGQIIDELYRHGGSEPQSVQLAIATNLTRGEFNEVWGANVLRRIEAICDIVDFFPGQI